MEVLWPMDRAVDGGEGQPGPELMPSGSCGVHSWIEGASGDGRQVSWFAPQNQGGGVATAWLFSSSRKSGRKKKEARRERRTRHREKEIRPGLMSVYPIAAEAGAWH